MRTEFSKRLARALDSARGPVARLRRWAVGRGAGARWTLAVTGLAALIGAGYLLTADVPAEPAWLDAGRALAPDDADQAIKALNAEGVQHVTRDPQGRLGVPVDQLAKAQALLEKHGLGARSVREINEESIQAGLFEPLSDVEQRRLRWRGRRIEAALVQLDPSLSPSVTLQRVRARGDGLRPGDELRATAYLLKVGADRPISLQTIEAIQELILAFEPELKPGGLKIVDSQGRTYLDPGNPVLLSRSRAQIRQEELEAEIRSRLDWIQGIRVSVKLDPALAPSPAAKAGAPEAAIMAPNVPLELEPAPAGATGPTAPAGGPGPARVFIQVPYGYYMQLYRVDGPRREPSRDDLTPYVAKVEESIRATVAHVIPAEELGGVQVDRINLPVPSRPTLATAAVDPRRSPPWWAPTLALAVVGALLLVGRRLKPRRPDRSARGSRRRRVDLAEGLANGPGPSERVRELVRLDPEAAAGVLQRWIGQGGHGA